MPIRILLSSFTQHPSLLQFRNVYPQEHPCKPVLKALPVSCDTYASMHASNFQSVWLFLSVSLFAQTARTCIRTHVHARNAYTHCIHAWKIFACQNRTRVCIHVRVFAYVWCGVCDTKREGKRENMCTRCMIIHFRIHTHSLFRSPCCPITRPSLCNWSIHTWWSRIASVLHTCTSVVITCTFCDNHCVCRTLGSQSTSFSLLVSK